MIEGCVNDALEPVVEIGLKQGEAVTTILATLDTGFGGALCLAEQHVDRLDMTFVYAEPYELANGEIIAKEVFKGTVVFDGREEEVNLILTASQDSLIGASLLRRYRVCIDYPQRTLQVIEALR
jgi:clan AA aspartic protease